MNPSLRVLLATLFLPLLWATSISGAPPRPPAQAEAYRLLREKKFAEAVDAFTALVRDNPYDGDLASAFGEALHGAGRDDEAIGAMKAAAELGWRPSAQLYNIACVLALRGKHDEAIEWLSKALDAGFAEQETLEKDSDMDSLRAEPRFVELTGLNPPPGPSRDEQWRYDLDFFARRMKQMHFDLYAKVPREKFLGEVERLKSDLPKLEDRQILVRLTRIVASVGDGHTRLRLAREGGAPAPRLPVRLYQFDDGLFITSIDPKHADEPILGAKVLRVGPMPVESALEALKPYCSVDSPMGYLSGGPPLLELPWFLEAIGAAAPDDRGAGGGAELTIRRRDGGEQTVTLEPIVIKREDIPKTFVRANKFAAAPLPLDLKDTDAKLRCEYLPQRKLLYFRFAGVVDPPDSTFEKYVNDELLGSMEKHRADYLVIDMRHNDGGNTGLVLPLIHGLARCDRVNRDGHLFVITSRDTFSAAVNTVTLLEQHTRAMFVGEPPGSPPSFVGESTYFLLPYHGNRVTCSSRYWQWGPSIDQRKWVAPQIAVKMRSKDFLENRDPMMEAIETTIDGETKAPSTQP
jgi:hypothetical protein